MFYLKIAKKKKFAYNYNNNKFAFCIASDKTAKTVTAYRQQHQFYGKPKDFFYKKNLLFYTFFFFLTPESPVNQGDNF